jgi:hypothetical protein
MARITAVLFYLLECQFSLYYLIVISGITIHNSFSKAWLMIWTKLNNLRFSKRARFSGLNLL